LVINRKRGKNAENAENAENIMKNAENAENADIPYNYKYRFFTFTSLSKTLNYPVQEWIGETVTNENVVIRWAADKLYIGSGYSEVGARNNMELVARSNHKIIDLQLEDLSKRLELEWVFPSGFLEE